MTKKLLLILPLLTAMLLVGCTTQDKPQINEQKKTTKVSEGILQVNDEGDTKINEKALAEHLSQSTEIELNKEEANGIKFMLEEEKLARDVYIKLYEKWGQQSFENISKSEETHMNAVQGLVDKYEIDASFFDDEVGKFTDEKLFGLYNDLVTQGEISIVDALKIGALIEEIDIIDLEGYLEETKNEDLILVYENLLRGSRNHLRSFTKTMTRQGQNYEPQRLKKAEYETIINSENERGNQNDGAKQKGSGQRRNSNL